MMAGRGVLPGSLATITVASSGSGGTGVTFYRDDATYPTVFDGFKIVATGTATAIALDYSDSAKTTDLTGKEKILKNLIVDGAGQTSGDTYCVLAGLYGGHTINNVYIQNNTVRNCLRDGIYIYTGNEALDNRISNITIRNNDVYGNGRASTSSGSGIKFKNRLLVLIAEYNYVHENVGGGIAFDSGPYTHAGPENITIRHNLIVNNTYTPDKWSAAIAFSSDYSSGMTCSAKIYDNIIWNPALTRGIYMTAYQAANDCDVDINNNVIRAKGPAIYANSYLATMRINNNILISNDSDLHVVVYDTATSITNHTANIYYRMDGSSSLVTRKRTTYTTSTLRTWEPTAYLVQPQF